MSTLTSQSGDSNATSSGSLNTVNQQTVQFADVEVPNEELYSAVSDATYDDGCTDQTDLGDFLGRPVNIRNYSWAEGTRLTQTFKPWEDFFNDAFIKKKLDNYGLIRCNLHLKLVINASPFYYGLGLMSYIPLSTFTQDRINFDTTDVELVPLSQAPHIWFYPQSSTGGDMELPFVHYNTWLDATDKAEFAAMGDIYLRSPNVLQNSNGVVGGAVEISIYAWATNVKVTAPTAQVALQSGDLFGEIQLQSGNKKKKMPAIAKSNSGAKDEYGKGVISLTASAVAQAAGSLASVPYIGPYMKATSVVANAASSVAAFFGWSNPPVLKPVDPVKDVPFHGFASSEISSPIEKLTLDPKNELCVDPRTVGLGSDDEMTISSIVQRESYLMTADWLSSDSTGSLIWSARVSPNLKRIVGGTVLYMTPVLHLSQFFEAWRGDIILRFQVICTQYHRGRLRIAWDPSGIPQLNSDTVNLVKIVDISEDTDFEVRIPYMQSAPWLWTQSDLTTSNMSTAINLGPISDYDNGALRLSVLNPLTAPTSSATVGIAISVRAAENFKYSMPRNVDQDLKFYNPALQSGDVAGSFNLATGNNNFSATMAETDDAGDPMTMVTMGESIVSIRQFLRRDQMSYWLPLAFDDSNVLNVTNYRWPRFPLFSGEDPNGIQTTNVAEKYNYVFNTHLNWMAPCYVGYRGSINWSVNLVNTYPVSSIKIIRDAGSRTLGGFVGVGGISDGHSQLKGSALYPFAIGNPGLSGMQLMNQNTQTGCRVQAPMYSRHRMMSCNPKTHTLGLTVDGSAYDNLVYKITTQPLPSGVNSKFAGGEYYVSAGTDFTFFMYLFVPTVYIYSDPEPGG
jgi:hypothetical protein